MDSDFDAVGSSTDEVNTPADAEQVIGGLPRRQVMLTMGGVMLALFLASLDQTVVGTAMPRIIADLGGFDRFTWVTSAYLVASTTAVPIVGRLSDFYGRKNFYIAGILIFLIGSVLAGFSQTMNQLIAFRAMQGIGGGIMMANAFVSIGDLFPPAERGKYQGILAGVFGLSSVIGPTLGGFITDNLTWNWIFFINIPIGVPIIILFIKFFPANRPTGERHRIDYIGMATLVVAVVSLLLGLSLAGVQYPWASVQIIGLLVVAAVVTVLFVYVESKVKDPIMPLEIYRNRIVSLSLIAVFLTGFGMFGGIIFIPLFFQGVLGASATSSGSFLTPMMLGMVFGAGLSGQALSRLGGHYRLQALFGLAFMSVGMFLITRMDADISYTQAIVNIVIMGFGLGVTFPVFTIAIQNAVPYSLLGVATSAGQFYRSIGGTLGLAVLGAFMVKRFASELESSLSSAVKAALPPGRLESLSENPQALVNPDALSRLKESVAGVGPEGPELAEQLVLGLKQSLATAISWVFIISLAFVLLAIVATVFLKETPLRRTERTSPPEPAGPPRPATPPQPGD